jgi:hypothetical protein
MSHRNRGPFKTATTIERQIGVYWLTIELAIKFTRELYDPGGWENPPYGGGVDSIDVAVEKVTVSSPDGTNFETNFTNRNSLGFCEFLMKTCKNEIDRAIENYEYEPEDDGDAAYDRQKDERQNG